MSHIYFSSECSLTYRRQARKGGSYEADSLVLKGMWMFWFRRYDSEKVEYSVYQNQECGTR